MTHSERLSFYGVTKRPIQKNAEWGHAYIGEVIQSRFGSQISKTVPMRIYVQLPSGQI